MGTIYHVSEEDFKNSWLSIKSWYYRPDDAAKVHEALKSGPHYKAVMHFLHVLDFYVYKIPSALEPLKPLYNRVFGERDLPLRTDDDFAFDTWSQLEDRALSGDEAAKELMAYLLSWAQRYHLIDEQNIYLDIALRAIFYYRPQLIGRVFLSQGLIGTVDDKVVSEFIYNHPFVFSPTREALSEPIPDDPGHRSIQLYWDHEPERYETELSQHGGFCWDPREETWTDFSRKMQKAFDKYKEGYMERMDAFMKQHGYVEIPREMRKKKLTLHMQWFIDYQLHGMQYKDIADEYSMEDEDGITDRNVSAAVKDISELLLLPLRS